MGNDPQAAYSLAWLLWNRGDWIYNPDPSEEDKPTISRLKTLIQAWEQADEPTLAAIKASLSDFTEGIDKPPSDPASFFYQPPDDSGWNPTYDSRAMRLKESLSLAADHLPANLRTLIASQLDARLQSINPSALQEHDFAFKLLIDCLDPDLAVRRLKEKPDQAADFLTQTRPLTPADNYGLETSLGFLIKMSSTLPRDQKVAYARQGAAIIQLNSDNLGNDVSGKVESSLRQLPDDQAAQLADVLSQAFREESSANSRFWLLTGLGILIERLEPDQIPPALQEHAADYAAAFTGPESGRPSQQAEGFQHALSKLTQTWQADKLTPLLASMAGQAGWTEPDATLLDDWLARVTPVQARNLWTLITSAPNSQVGYTKNPLLPRLLLRLPAPFVASLPKNPTAGSDLLASLPDTTPFAATLKPPTLTAAL